MTESDLGINFEDLRTSVDWSDLRLSKPRKNRVEAIKEMVGFHYSDNGSDMRVPTNYLELAVTIYARQLAARAPQCLISTPTSKLRPFAKNMELAINQIPEEIDLEKTIRMAVIEALFSMGIIKLGTAANGNYIMGHDVGESFVDLVTIDDYICDMTAKSRKTMQYEGNSYWVPVEVARSMYEGKSKDIEPDDHRTSGTDGEATADSVGSDEGGDMYREKVWLRDIYLFHSNKLVTYAVTSHKILNIIGWDGPDKGPYRTLGFSEVPGNILPLPPVALWRDLHELGNTLFRRLGKQAVDKKTVATFQGGNDEDVEALKKASDGEGIKYTGQKPENITVGGIDSPTLAFYLQTRDLFSYFAGNLDSLGGLSPMTDTVGQDKLLSDAASARMNFMRDETISFNKDIFKALAWYEWTNPLAKRIIQKPIPDTDIVIKTEWSPETRDGDFLDYNIDIDVFSMQDQTPAIKLQKLGETLERFILPLLPIIQQQGGQFNVKRLLELIGEYGNMPEVKELVMFQDSVESFQNEQVMGNPNPVPMPNNTTRTYERVNRPGATRQGKDHVMSQLLMGGNVQADELATIGRSTG